MRKVIIAAVLASAGVAAQTNNQYLQPWFDSMKQQAELTMRNRELDEVRRHNLAAEAIMREQSRAEYRERHNNASDWRINQDMRDAFNACRALHDDCEQLDTLMSIIAGAIKPDWSKLTVAEYVESLYAIAKTANFAEPARRIVFSKPVPQPH